MSVANTLWWLCRQRIIDTLAPNATTLASQKFASNVLETCLQVGSQAQKDCLTRAIAGLPANPPDASSAPVPEQGEPQPMRACSHMLAIIFLNCSAGLCHAESRGRRASQSCSKLELQTCTFETVSKSSRLWHYEIRWYLSMRFTGNSDSASDSHSVWREPAVEGFSRVNG